MTYEEAIKHFNSLQKRYTTEHNGKMCEKVALALEAMEKQVLKKPAKDGYFRLCPHCETEEIEFEIEDSLEYEKFDFCPRCGQAIDWGADEET